MENVTENKCHFFFLYTSTFFSQEKSVMENVPVYDRFDTGDFSDGQYIKDNCNLKNEEIFVKWSV